MKCMRREYASRDVCKLRIARVSGQHPAWQHASVSPPGISALYVSLITSASGEVFVPPLAAHNAVSQSCNSKTKIILA